MSRVKRVGVLIAGAGPVGLLAAIALRQRNTDVVIFDQGPRPTTRSYALALHPATVALLDSYGLGPRLMAEGRVIETMSFHDAERPRAELHFRAAREDFPHLVVMPQASLERMLQDLLGELGTTVKWDHRVARVMPSSDGPAAVTIAKLGDDSVGYPVARTERIVTKELEYEADVVLGMDGHRSAVRQNLFIDYPEVDAPDIFAVFETELDTPLPDIARVGLSEATTDVVWPLTGNGCRFGFRLEDTGEPIAPRLKSRLLVELHDDVYRTVPAEALDPFIAERLPWFDIGVRAIRWSALVKFERRLAASFGQGNVWLAGDAAHLASPLSGVSMNVGLQEGDELARLAAGVVSGASSVADLEAYGRRRTSVWHDLLGLESSVAPLTSCDEWVAANASRIAACLPASGEDRVRLAKALGLAISTPNDVAV